MLGVHGGAGGGLALARAEAAVWAGIGIEVSAGAIGDVAALFGEGSSRVVALRAAQSAFICLATVKSSLLTYQYGPVSLKMVS